jgi:hypothetical protein
MRPQQIMFMGLILAAGTLISLTFAGAWLGGTDVAVANSFTVFKQVNIMGLWSVTIPNIDFFLSGAKSLIMMDFAFFSGAGQILQWFLFFTLGLGVIWGFFTVVIGIVSGVFRR